MQPDLSVTIASINGADYLRECLRALGKQHGCVNAEVIVADCVGAEVTGMMKREFPSIRLIAFQEKQSVPKLRAAALAQTQGRIIAITEDHCIPPPDWFESVLRAHQVNPRPAIGGAVDNGATKRIIDWAVFFCEYSNFISPVASGVVHDLPGPNVSYKREALSALREMIKDEYWETFVHGQLESEGKELWSDPSVKVIHKKHFRFTDFLSERFHYSRAFAGTRNESMTLAKRFVYLCASPLLPPVLLLRISRRVFAKKQHLPQFALSLPYILTFMIAWAVGECVGYATGPGDSALYLT
jgi:glycosyltransferase involved in cell wall biosynthesis